MGVRADDGTCSAAGAAAGAAGGAAGSCAAPPPLDEAAALEAEAAAVAAAARAAADPLLPAGLEPWQRANVALQRWSLFKLQAAADPAGALPWAPAAAAGLAYCNFEGVNCDKWGNVLIINTGGAELRGTLPPAAALVNLKQLKIFEAASANLTGTLPADWSALRQLEEVVLPYGRLQGTLPRQWANLGKLKKLFLFNNQLTGSLPPEWGQGMASVELFAVQNNKLTGPIPDSFSGMTAMSENQLEGTLPAVLGAAWPRVETVSIGINRFQGTLPPEWGAMANMRNMRLEANTLVGPIPESWGGWERIEHLWLLANAGLYGCHPGSLGARKVYDEWEAAWSTGLEKRPCAAGEAPRGAGPRAGNAGGVQVPWSGAGAGPSAEGGGAEALRMLEMAAQGAGPLQQLRAAPPGAAAGDGAPAPAGAAAPAAAGAGAGEGAASEAGYFDDYEDEGAGDYGGHGEL
ncbi:MAG: hypothetical protein J3K34DRAFT_486177 [Monoraphidium minutum]|nr:MAG: hypothetical protein J3K34DRAFT_486177 [Monoraphidium minutum]